MACTTTNRRRQERSTATASTVPTVPTVADSCTAGWLATDIYLAELYVNRADQRVYTRGTTGIFELTTAIGQPVHGGTNDRFLYIDNSGNLTGDAQATRDSTTKYTTIHADVDTPTDAHAGLTITNDFIGLGIKGVQISYQHNSDTEIYFCKAGDDTAVGTARTAAIGYFNKTTFAEAAFDVLSSRAAMYVNDDGGNYVIAQMRDPEGLELQGKDDGDTNFLLRTYQGADPDFTGNLLHSFRNDGQVVFNAGADASEVLVRVDPGTDVAGAGLIRLQTGTENDADADFYNELRLLNNSTGSFLVSQNTDNDESSMLLVQPNLISMTSDDLTTNDFSNSVTVQNDNNGIILFFDDGTNESSIILNNLGIHFTGAGTGNRIGYFGVTPIVRQTTSSQTPATFVSNTSGIINDSATWDGYTFGDVVAILRAYGHLT